MRVAHFFNISVFLIAVISNAPFASAETVIKKLPYTEADSELDSTDGDELLAWANKDKVLFGTARHSGFSDPSCSTKKPHPECPSVTFDKSKILMLFDVRTTKTSFNIKNQFLEKQLDAFKRYKRDCPYDKEGDVVIGLKIRHVRLKPMDGCIRVEESVKNNLESNIFYIKPNGKKIPLEDSTNKSNVGGWAWIGWLNAYVLGTNTSSIYSTSTDGDISPTTARLFTTDGALKFVEMSERNLSSIRPTRAGMVAAVRQQGILLWRNDSRYIIAEGDNIRKLEVSPDGCQVAYLVPRRVDEMRGGFLRDVTYSNLRVVDVCKGLGVARNANPFAKLLNSGYFLPFVKSATDSFSKNLSRLIQAF